MMNNKEPIDIIGEYPSDIKIWHFEARTYIPYDKANKWLVVLGVGEEHLDGYTFTQCAHCGAITEVGSMYTSRMIHTNVGFGYSVCEECYNKERKLEMDSLHDVQQ